MFLVDEIGQFCKKNVPVDTDRLNKNKRTSGVSRGSWVGGWGRDEG